MTWLLNGDAFQIPLRDETVQAVITSPPFFGLRDYQVDGQIGLEPTPEQYVTNLVAVFREVRRVLRSDGCVFLNLGDSYASSGAKGSHGVSSALGRKVKDEQARAPTPPGLKPKDLCGIPWRVVFGLQADGWWWRSALPWIKKNAMPESVTDRPTTSHEYWFLLTKSRSYYYDAEAVRQKHTRAWWADNSCSSYYAGKAKPSGRNRRTSDTFFESLDALITEQRQYLAHLERVSDEGGFLVDEDGEPLALVYSTKPFSGIKLVRDYVGANGKSYIASPDCPIHGHLARHQIPYNRQCDAQSNCPETHNPDIDTHLAEEPVVALSAKTSHRFEDEPCESVLPQILENTFDNKNAIGHPESTSDEKKTLRTNRIQESHDELDRSTDSHCPDSSQTAIVHNTQSHKTGHASETSQPYTPYDEIPSCIDDKPMLLDSVALDENKTENSIHVESLPLFDIPVENASHSSRKQDQEELFLASLPPKPDCTCTCKICQVDHFATFNPDMIEPLLLCSTSARGACPKCGKAWKRVVERPQWGTHDSETNYPDQSNAKNLSHSRQFYRKQYGTEGPPPSTTTGWRPQCHCYGAPEQGPVTCGKCGGIGKEQRQGIICPKDETGQEARGGNLSITQRLHNQYPPVETGAPCPACDGSGTVTGDVWPDDVDDWPTVPCVVLDPFMGSGTTGLVAIEHHRRFVGLELNREYIGLAQQRTGAVQVRLL